MAGVLVERVQDPVVGELEDVVAVHDGRELEQGMAVVDPQRPERRDDGGWGGEEAGVVLVVAVQGPGEAVRARLRERGSRLGHEAGVGVVDAARPVALVQVAGEGERSESERQAGRDGQPGATGAGQQSPAALVH